MNKLNGFLSKMKSVITILCVLTLSFILVASLGVTTFDRVFNKNKTESNTTTEKQSVALRDYNLDNEVLEGMKIAHQAAYDYTAKELDKWIGEMLSRADEDFLGDYFGFMNTKRREVLSLYNKVYNYLDKSHETAEEAALRELEEELSQKVIKPEISQARIKNITDGAISLYLLTLEDNLRNIQEKYQYPTLEWNEYISSLCNITLSVDDKKYPLAFKSAVVSSAGLLGYGATAITPVIKNVATKVSKVATRTAAKGVTTGTAAITAKTAGTAAKSLPYIGWGITAAIAIWDIVDYAQTSSEGKELLRKSLEEYFNEIKTELLSDSENSIMGVITQWENNVRKNLSSNQ